MNSLFRVLTRCMVCVFGLVWLSAANAQNSPEVTRGLQWLAAQVQSDGSLINEPRSIATILQNRTEVAQTLKLLSSTPAGLQSGISGSGEDNTEYLARKVLSLTQNGWDASTWLNLLLARQNPDGGLGGAPGYASTQYDTAWMVLALAQTSQTNSVATTNARAFLAKQILADGGVAGGNDWGRMHDGALVLLALQTTPGGGDPNLLKNLGSWLLQRQSGNGSWADNTYLSALVFSALSPVTADDTVRNNVGAFFLARQAQDGSWDQDPFLTALVLRALSARNVATIPAANGAIKGLVVDRASNAPLSGVSVTMVTPVNRAVTTDANGAFTFAGLGSTTYSLNFSRTGYAGVAATINVNSGQTSDMGTVALSQLNTASIIRGQVVAGGSNAPLAGVSVSIAGAQNGTLLTDANGRYEFGAVTPGSYTLSASLGGYQSASGSGSVVAGQTLIFSPALYANGQTPPVVLHYSGKVVASGNGTPLAGVTVQLSGTANLSAVTASNGQFDVVVSPGNYQASFTLAGYDAVSQNFAVPSGTNIDGGVIRMNGIRTSSSVKGRVADSANVGIAGAQVQLAGTDKVTTTRADGSYSLDNITDTSFTLRASAAGYNSQAVTLQLSRPGEVNQDFVLLLNNAGDLSIGDLSVTPLSVGSNTNVIVNTTIRNAGTVSNSAVLQLQVQDSNGKIIGSGLAYDEANQLIGQVNLPPASQKSVHLVWNSAQFLPGDYVLKVRLVEPGSITRATPLGNLLTERGSGVAIVGLAQFTGAITADPPVLQAGTNTVVKMTAVVQNNGNQAIATQPFSLIAVDTSDNSVAYTQQVNADALPVNQVQGLSFPDWTPSKAGNYRLELAAQDASLGKITGALYVGDAAKASYTVNKLVVPAGTQNVKATISVSGQDVTGGSISDPLAPLIKTAIQKAIPASYNTAVSETLSDRCLRCHVQAQALVGGELTRKISDNASVRVSRDVIFNSLTAFQQSNGAIDGHPSVGAYQRTQSMLSLWALNSWHNKAEVASTLAKGATFLTTVQNADGTWSPDHASGWWSTAEANAAFNLKSLVDTVQTVNQAAPGSVRTWAANRLTSQNINGPYYLASDASGNVYESNYYTGQILLVKPDGTTSQYMSGLTNPLAMVFGADGMAYVASYNGVYRRNPDGSSTQISDRHAAGIVLGPDQKFYVSSYWENKIFTLTPGGVATDYVSGGLLNNPISLAFTPAGELVVLNYSSQQILRYQPDLTVNVAVAWTRGAPRHIQPMSNGYLVTTDDTGLYFYSQEWHAERLLYEGVSGVAVTPSGDIYIGQPSNNTVSRVLPTAIDAAAFKRQMDPFILKATNWLLVDGNIDTNNHLSLAQRLIGLNSAKQYYDGQPLAATLQAKMLEVGQLLRSRVHADGGWGWTTGYGNSDSLVTSQVGLALDSLNPSPSDPIVQKAVKWLLGQQNANGSWYSENGILGTPFATTTWVSIWLPTVLDRLGGVDTDLTVTFPANVGMSNPDLAPVSNVINPDGTNTVRWSMVGVTSAGRNIHYDLRLADMGVDETRRVSTDAHLTFKNSFTNGIVEAPVNVPAVKASAFLSLGVATDKSAYPADSLVGIVAQVTNTGENLSSGKVRLEVYAPDATLISNLVTLPFNGVSSSASVNLNGNWNTGQAAAGAGYFVQASLYDSLDRYVGKAEARFAILPSGTGTGTASLAGKITTDKQLYLPSETVQLRDALTSLTQNVALNDLTVVTTLTNPDNSLRFTSSEALLQLAAGGSKDYGYSVPLNFGAPGQYTAQLNVKAKDGTVLAQSQTRFTVASSSDTGIGLKGALVLSPKLLPVGESLVLGLDVSNSGNTALANLPLTLRIVDPVAQKTVAEYPYQTTLAVGGKYSANANWLGAGTVGTNFVAVLSARLGGKDLTLAQDTFTLIAAPVKLSLSQSLLQGSRVLVLVSCAEDEDEDDDDDDEHHDFCDHGDDDHGHDDDHGDSNRCTVKRSQLIAKNLTALKVPYLITSNATSFQRALRSGKYNVYWISGRQDKLHGSLPDEVREAVYAGDGIIFDGTHDQRNKSLDTVAGLVWRGKIGETGLPVEVNGPLLPPARITSTGRALKVQTSGTSVAQGRFNGRTPNADGPAIISNRYGNGLAMSWAFDLVSSIGAQNAWTANLGAGLQAVQPVQSSTLTPGAVLALKTQVGNLVKAVDVTVKTTVPARSVVLTTQPQADWKAADSSVNWAFNLAENQVKELLLSFQAPPVAGSFSLRTTVATVKGSTATPYGTPLDLAFNVVAASTTQDAVKLNLQALVLGSKEKKLRDSLISQLQTAMVSFNRNSVSGYESAIGQLIQIVDQLPGLGNVDTRQIHTGLDRLIREAQWRWVQVSPAKP